MTSHSQVAACRHALAQQTVRMEQWLWIGGALGVLLTAFGAVSLHHARSGRETAALSCHRLSPSDVEDLVKGTAAPPPSANPRSQPAATVNLLQVGLPSRYAPMP